MKLALIGYGVIGQAVADGLRGRSGVSIVGVLTRSGAGNGAAPPVTTLEALLERGPDVIIECASQDALCLHGEPVLAAGCSLVAASIGAFADVQLYERMRKTARESAARLRLPSGGLAGTDTLAAAKHIGLDTVTYRGSAPPVSWGLQPDAPAQVLFDGNARDACRDFPKNANVAAAVSLGGIGFERTRVQLIADPERAKYRHEIMASGAFGELATAVDAEPIAAGQRSTRLIAGSLIAAALSIDA